MGIFGGEIKIISGQNKRESSNKNVKVSILVPCCNVEKYIVQCIESILSQTLKEIEIICINDGSKDNTLSILKSYAEKDHRLKIIDKPNSGYGDSMNKGLNLAVGEYIGIIESDDFAESNMFEELYKVAKNNDADVVKSNFWLYWSNPECNELFKFFSENECGFVFNPKNHDSSSMFGRKPSIWSAIYKRSFLNKNEISFLTTPGASFQDTSFTFKVNSACERMVALYDAFVHYRQDNENSSVNNADKKSDFVCIEYDEIERFITESESEKKLYPIYAAMFYDACIWMYERLSISKRYLFLKKISPKFQEIIEKIGLNSIDFKDGWWKYRDIVRIATNPFEYHMWRNVERYDQTKDLVTYKPPKTPVGNKNFYLNKKSHKENKEKPFFSVIIPVYNNERYLRSCLESLLLQSEQDFEVICVNDGSTDHSLSVIEEYAEISDKFIVINQVNSGPSEARNCGLDLASGKYILFLDSDDYFAEDTCKILKSKILSDERQVDAVLFGTELFPETPRASEWHYKTLTTENRYFEKITQRDFLTVPYLNIYSWRYCINNDFIINNKLRFETKFKYGEDAIFVFSFVTKLNGLLVISDKLYNYRHYREGSLINEITKDKVAYTKIQLKILKKLLDVSCKNGFAPSKDLLEYCCDFIYNCISTCPEPRRTTFIYEFVDIVKQYDLDGFANEASDNCRGFWLYCINLKKINKQKKSFKKSFRRFVAKLIWPSRRVFYDNVRQLHERMQTQQDTVNFLIQQITELQNRYAKQEELLLELKKEIGSSKNETYIPKNSK